MNDPIMRTDYRDKVHQFFNYIGNPKKFEEITILILIYDFKGSQTDGIGFLLGRFQDELRINLSQIPTKENKESHLINITRTALQQGYFWFNNKLEKEILNKYRNVMPGSREHFFNTCSAYEKYIIMAYNVYDSIGRFIKIVCKDYNIDPYPIYVKAERERDFFTDDEITDANQRRYQEAIHEEASRAVNLREKHEKIKWLGTPSQFGFLIMELIRQGYIEPPKKNSEYSYKALAGSCFNAFDITGSPQTLEKELSERTCSLSETKRAKFTIPHISDIK